MYTFPWTPLTPLLKVWRDLVEGFEKELNTVLIFTYLCLFFVPSSPKIETVLSQSHETINEVQLASSMMH